MRYRQNAKHSLDGNDLQMQSVAVTVCVIVTATALCGHGHFACVILHAIDEEAFDPLVEENKSPDTCGADNVDCICNVAEFYALQ